MKKGARNYSFCLRPPSPAVRHPLLSSVAPKNESVHARDRVRAFMQNRPALPFDPVAGSDGPSGPDNGLRSQLAFSRLIHECMYIRSGAACAIGPDDHAAACPGTIGTWAMPMVVTEPRGMGLEWPFPGLL